MNSTEDDTFDKLRRVSYEEACVIYTMACMHLTGSSEELNRAAGPDLRVAGWTVESLTEEGRKREREECQQKQ